MTVGELKQLLEPLADDKIILIDSETENDIMLGVQEFPFATTLDDKALTLQVDPSFRVRYQET